jgi:peptidoglycan/LPS O-acetylase OafA/YrhL
VGTMVFRSQCFPFVFAIAASFGWAGVAIFFVVSGFCIHLSFTRRPEWPAFFQRRFWRIYPPYLAALLFFSVLFPIAQRHLHLHARFDAAQFFTHLTLLNNSNDRFFLGINPSFWSIAVEVQLYALYPLLLVFAARFGWPGALLGLGVLEVALRLTDGGLFTFTGAALPRWLSGSPLMYWFSWSLGAFVAERQIRGNRLVAPGISLVVVGTLAVACSSCKPLYNMSFLLFALLAAGVIVALLNDADRQFMMPARLRQHLTKVGLCSYSLYLLHEPLLRAIAGIGGKLLPKASIHPVLLFMLCLASWFLVVPIAFLSYKFCEIPSIALGKKLFGKRSQTELVGNGARLLRPTPDD